MIYFYMALQGTFMKRKLPEYVIKAREAHAQAEKNSAMGLFMFVIGIVFLSSLIGSFLR